MMKTKKKLKSKRQPDNVVQPSTAKSFTRTKKKSLEDPPSQLQVSATSVDLYSSIFPDASSSEEDDLTVASKNTKIKNSEHLSSIANKTKPLASSSTRLTPLIDNSFRNKKYKSNILPKIKHTPKIPLPAVPIMADSDSNSDSDLEDSEYKDEINSDVELIGVAINGNNKIRFNAVLENTELKQEVNSEGEEDSKLSNSTLEETDEMYSNRTVIRNELANLSFEELENLKQKLGSKTFNEAVFGKGNVSIANNKQSSRNKKQVFKRDNKNRPRELHARIHVPKTREVIHVKKVIRRDPRFEDSCGELDTKIWEHNYEFLKEIKHQEAKELKKSLKTEQNEERKTEVKKYLQSLKNKETSDAVKVKELQKRKQEKEENIKRLKEGKNPFYIKKSTRKFVDLAEKYEELKASGGLEKYLKKKRKKNLVRDKKAMKIAPKI